MTNNKGLPGVLGFLLLLTSFALGAAEPPYATGFDPSRDPFADFRLAAGRAEREDKKVLIEIGGEWCSWCHLMAKYLSETPVVRKALLEAFVVLKVNVSEENPNAEFVSYLPEIRGVPFFVIADPDGQIIGAQETASLERGDWYSDQAFLAFIERWR